MLLPTWQFTLDTWRANFRCSSRSKQSHRESESERDAKSVTKRERGNSLKELDNRSRCCSSRFTCGDIVLKFCASNKVISMKLSLFIVTLCDCVHREPLWRPPNRGLYGSLDLEALLLYCQPGWRFTICAPPIEISCWNFTIFRIKSCLDRGLVCPEHAGIQRPEHVHSTVKQQKTKLKKNHKIKLPVDELKVHKENLIGLQISEKLKYPGVSSFPKIPALLYNWRYVTLYRS